LISYGMLGDVLGYRPGENLGDTPAASASFAKAVELAETARQQDPADQRALFDVANARLRLGSLLSDAEPRQAAAALVEFEQVEHLVNELLAKDPKSERYGFVGLVAERRRGEMLAAMGQRIEAIRRLEAARSAAARFLGGPNGPNARTQLLLASIRLGVLRAQGGETAAATALADFVSTELGKKPIAPPMLDASTHRDVAGAYIELAKHARAAERTPHLQRAVSHLERSAALWRALKIAAPIEPRRAKEVAALEVDLASIRKNW
jgi:tetratricopeptide (TPR) repeat protein